jgi:hypothetical protein
LPSNKTVVSAAFGFNPKGEGILASIGDLYAAGWRLRTGLPLPAALLWGHDERPGTPDLTFVPGAVPEALADPVLDLPALQISAAGTALVRLNGIGRFLLHGTEVTCNLETEPDAPEVTAAIYGNVLACICWRRGQLAFHGSAVAIANRAVLMLGPRELGKSLLAAALARRGHCVLSDEVASVAGGRCFPAGSMLSLADDTLIAAGIAPDPLPQYTNFPLAKRLWIAGPRPQPRAYEIAAVLRLKKAEPEAAIEPARLESDVALETLLDQFYRRDMLRILETGIGARREAEALIAAAPVYRFPVPRSLDRVEEVTDHIIDLVR